MPKEKTKINTSIHLDQVGFAFHPFLPCFESRGMSLKSSNQFDNFKPAKSLKLDL